MLLRYLVLALAGGLAVDDALASAIRPSSSKRDVPATHVLHERQLPHWSRSWTKTHKVPPRAMLPMRIGLKQSNLEAGHDLLMNISNPESGSYGKHLSAEEVIDFFAPSESTVDIVKDWIIGSGIRPDRVSLSANKQWLQFDGRVHEVEDLLVTDYFVYEHRQTGSKDIAADKYHIPAHIKEHIDYITPGIRLRTHPGKVRKLERKGKAESLRRRGVSSDITALVPFREGAAGALPGLPSLNISQCDVYVTNECIRRQYGVPKGNKAAPGNELGIFESLNDHYSKEDLDVYWSTLYPEIPNGTYPIEKLIDGATGAVTNISDAGDESNLDFQSAWPLIWPQKTILFQTDDNFYEVNQTSQTTPYVGFWNTFLDAIDGSYCTYSAYGETGDCTDPACLDPSYPDPNPGGYKGQLQCGVYKPTNVISISYGGGEADVPAYYLQRQCSEIMKLTLQGVTVVVSSGDYGVGTYPGDDGLASGCAGPSGTVFYPATAGTCPYVLAVGSTEFDKSNSTNSNSTCKLNEVATAQFPSGGGFSNVFPTADYQKDAVATYFGTTHLNFSGYTNEGTNFTGIGLGVYNATGRGYPDVAAIGDRFVIRVGGQWGTIGGTSLAAPVWAALITRVNEERIAAGKKTVGFVNPVLYQHPEVFTDITVGSNPNCKSSGFVATKGWDPVTGLGSPKYPKLLSLLMSLP